MDLLLGQMIIKGEQLECSQNALLGLGNLTAHVRELGVGKLGEWHGWGCSWAVCVREVGCFVLFFKLYFVVEI